MHLRLAARSALVVWARRRRQAGAVPNRALRIGKAAISASARTVSLVTMDTY